MLLVKFKIGDNYYAIDTDNVVEIVPAITFRPIPGTPDFFVGIFDYHGQIIPVIDVCRLTINTPSILRLSTRVILLNFPFKDKKKILGLLAEDVTDVIDVEESLFQNTGISSEKAPFLSSVCKYEGQLVQLIQIEKLFSQELQEKVFSLFNHAE